MQDKGIIRVIYHMCDTYALRTHRIITLHLITYHMKKNILTALLIMSMIGTGTLLVHAQGLGLGADIQAQTGAHIQTGRGIDANIQASTTASLRIEQNMSNARQRADQEIDRRIQTLTALSTRINSMKFVSLSEKESFAAQLQANISDLANLKIKVGSDTDTTTLRTDIKSIVGSYRTFLLVIPQGNLLAAADRINIIVTMMTNVGTKLQARISAAQSTGTNVTAMQTALADFNAKIANAKIQAQAAQSGIVSLTSDQGNQTQFDANKTALIQARTDIKAGSDDLKAARQDAHTIIQTLIQLGAHAPMNVSASTTASTSVQ